MRRGATFDESQAYRYTLWRSWDPARARVGFVMLNPSTADHRQDDPTIRRCIDFARRWGYGSLLVVNLFAYRASSPSALRRTADPIGPRNEHYLRYARQRTADLVVAWGVHGALMGQHERALSRLGSRRRRPLLCLGVTKGGFPRHPLYLPASCQPGPWPGEISTDC